MPRNVEDIIPSKKRSIRDVPVPEERRHRGRRSTDRLPEEGAGVVIPIHKEHVREDVHAPTATEVETDHVREFRRETATPRMKGSLHRESLKGGGSKRVVWIALGLLLLVLAFGGFSLLKSATLTYTPKSASLTFQNEAFNAYKTGGEGILLFSVVKISDSKGLPIQATGETQVSRKASGSIIVYNNASAQSQQLVKTTRFQTPDGKIYRIQTDISVPGKSASAPGSLEVKVVADEPGASYNIGLSDFTLPGLKGDPKFKTVYARSKTPMTGGAVGSEKAVSPENLADAKTKIESTLGASLVEQAQAQVPPDFILYPSLSVVTYEDLPQSSSTATAINVNERGNFYGVIFKKSDLADYIKTKKLSLPGNQDITINGLSALNLTFTGTSPDDLLKATSISFQINGSATAIYSVDELALKKDLAGTSKSDLSSVLKNYPGIQSADAVIRPFWKTSFPNTSEDITITKSALK